VQARTGSGKTCAFLIPLVEKLLSTLKGEYGGHVRGLVLSPTRELSIQTLRVFTKLTAHAPEVRAVGIHGGEAIEKQFHLLSSKPDVVIATPGRLAHHLEEIPDFKLSGCLMCVLDEADRLFEMGFGLQIRQIASTLPDSCQKLLYSATMPRIVVDFTKTGFTTNPTVVRLDDEVTVSDELRIAFVTCRSTDKDAALLHVMEKIRHDAESHSNCRTGLTLVFAATRYHVEYITTLLHSSGIEAVMIYGSLDQEAREANLAAFRRKERNVLVVVRSSCCAWACFRFVLSTCSIDIFCFELIDGCCCSRH
jgi:ATP-dependent RNA helicase DDX54/DBP10